MPNPRPVPYEYHPTPYNYRETSEYETEKTYSSNPRPARHGHPGPRDPALNRNANVSSGPEAPQRLVHRQRLVKEYPTPCPNSPVDEEPEYGVPRVGIPDRPPPRHDGATAPNVAADSKIPVPGPRSAYDAGESVRCRDPSQAPPREAARLDPKGAGQVCSRYDDPVSDSYFEVNSRDGSSLTQYDVENARSQMRKTNEPVKCEMEKNNDGGGDPVMRSYIEHGRKWESEESQQLNHEEETIGGASGAGRSKGEQLTAISNHHDGRTDAAKKTRFRGDSVLGNENPNGVSSSKESATGARGRTGEDRHSYLRIRSGSQMNVGSGSTTADWARGQACAMSGSFPRPVMSKGLDSEVKTGAGAAANSSPRSELLVNRETYSTAANRAGREDRSMSGGFQAAQIAERLSSRDGRTADGDASPLSHNMSHMGRNGYSTAANRVSDEGNPMSRRYYALHAGEDLNSTGTGEDSVVGSSPGPLPRSFQTSQMKRNTRRTPDRRAGPDLHNRHGPKTRRRQSAAGSGIVRDFATMCTIQ